MALESAYVSMGTTEITVATSMGWPSRNKHPFPLSSTEHRAAPAPTPHAARVPRSAALVLLFVLVLVATAWPLASGLAAGWSWLVVVAGSW